MLRSVDLTRRLPEKQVVKAIKRNLLFDPVPPPEDVSESKRARILPYWAPRLGIFKSRIEIMCVLSFIYVLSYLYICSLILYAFSHTRASCRTGRPGSAFSKVALKLYVFSMVISRSKNTRTLTVEIARQAGNLPCYRHQYLPLNDLGICERVRALVPSKCPGNRPRTTCIYAGTPPRVCSLDICVLLMLYMCSLI